jgi:hypothetical protein
MKSDPQTPQTPKPVAYDTEGRPLYAHPPEPQTTQDSSTQVPHMMVQMTRPLDPIAPTISEEAIKRHKDSVSKFPHLNLSEGEFVISAIHRHPIGLVQIWGVVVFIALLTFIGLPILALNVGFDSLLGNSGGSVIASLGFIVLMLNVLFILGGIIATIVYNGNRFYLTNESAQHRRRQLPPAGNYPDTSELWLAPAFHRR